MRAGWLNKAIVGSSILLALSLVGVGVCTRNEALVASVVRQKTYREIRADGGKLSALVSTGWEEDQPMRFGYARPNELLRPSRMQGSGTRLILLDQTEAFLFPRGPARGWPVQKTAGATYRHGYVPQWVSSARIVGTPTTLAARPTTPLRESGSNPSGSKFDRAIPWPSLSLDGGTSGRGIGADEGLSLKENTSLSLKGGPRPFPRSEPPPFRTVDAAVSAPLAPMPRFERWTAPIWMIAVAMLTPAGLSGLVTVARWRRRRSRARRGQCTACGYDLRGNPSSGTCPECGATAQAVANGTPSSTS